MDLAKDFQTCVQCSKLYREAENRSECDAVLMQFQYHVVQIYIALICTPANGCMCAFSNRVYTYNSQVTYIVGMYTPPPPPPPPQT